jgi:hypothetical protein
MKNALEEAAKTAFKETEKSVVNYDWFKNTMNDILNGIMQDEYMKPEPVVKYMSISELASILNYMRMTSSVMDNDSNATLQDVAEMQKKVALVLRWLLCNEKTNITYNNMFKKVFKGTDSEENDKKLIGDANNKQNTFMNEFNVLSSATLKIFLVVDIEDQCSNRLNSLEFECDRNDAYLMGLVSAGILEDFEELIDEIHKLKQFLETSVKTEFSLAESVKSNISNYSSWMANMAVAFTKKFLIGKLGTKDTEFNTELFIRNSFGKNRNQTFQILLEYGMQEKLFANFIDFDSPGTTLIISQCTSFGRVPHPGNTVGLQ